MSTQQSLARLARGSLPYLFFTAAWPAAGAIPTSAKPTSAIPAEMETLTVQGSRLEQAPVMLASTVIDRESIKLSGAQTLTDVLRGLPSVSITQSGSLGSLSELRVRGSESNHVLVLLDGVVINDISQGGLIDLAHISLAGIERIEFSRGGQSAVWGSGAVSAVINIITKNDGQAPTTVTAGMGNHDTQTLGLSTSQRLEQLNYNAYAQYTKSDGSNVALVGNEDDGYRNTTVGFNSTWQFTSEQQLSLTSRYVDFRNEFDGVDAITTGKPADADNVTEGDKATVAVNYRYKPTQSAWHTTFEGQWHRDNNDNYSAGASAGGNQGRQTRLNWANYWQASAWQAVAGVEYNQRLFSQYGEVSWGDPNQRQHETNKSVFAELAAAVTDTLSLSSSARYDNFSRFNNDSSYRLTAQWQATPQVQLYLTTAKAIKVPTFTERFGYYPDTFIGNPELTPEASKEWEVGMQWQINSLNLTLAAFDANLEDEILGFVYVPELFSFTAANSTQDSERRGLEFTADLNYALVQWQFNYSYLDAKQTANGMTTRELRRPRHLASMQVGVQNEDCDCSGFLKFSYTGERFDTYYPPYPALAETQSLANYVIVSLNFQAQISSQLSINVSAQNAFDTQYEDIIGYRGQPRQVNATVTYEF